MRNKPLPFVPLLLACLISTQLCCARGTLTQAEPTPSPSPTEQAQIEQILQRYEQAIGGKEALDALTSYRLKATFTFPGMAGTLEAWRKEPLKTLSVTHFPRIGTLKKGFDGETRWVQTPAGTFSESGSQEIAELEREADAYSAGKIRAFFDTLKLEHKAWLSGRDVYVIEGKPAKGPAEKLFFDVENGLLLRWDMARRRQDRGTVWVKIHFDDYRDVGEVKLPFKMRFAFEQFNFNVQVNEVEHNIEIDDAIFRKP